MGIQGELFACSKECEGELVGDKAEEVSLGPDDGELCMLEEEITCLYLADT